MCAKLRVQQQSWREIKPKYLLVLQQFPAMVDWGPDAEWILRWDTVLKIYKEDLSKLI